MRRRQAIKILRRVVAGDASAYRRETVQAALEKGSRASRKRARRVRRDLVGWVNHMRAGFL